MNRGHNRRLSETRINILDVRCLFCREIGVRANTARRAASRSQGLRHGGWMCWRAPAGTSVPSSAHWHICTFRKSVGKLCQTWFFRHLLVWLAVVAAAHVGIVTAGRSGSPLLQTNHTHDVCIAVSELTCILLRLLGCASPRNCDAIVSTRKRRRRLGAGQVFLSVGVVGFVGISSWTARHGRGRVQIVHSVARS